MKNLGTTGPDKKNKIYPSQINTSIISFRVPKKNKQRIKRKLNEALKKIKYANL